MSSTLMTASSILKLDREKLESVIFPLVSAHGAEVYDMEFTSGAQGPVFRVFVERLGSEQNRWSTEKAAVSLDLCSNIARELSPALDVIDVIADRYILEVSSPGIERELKKSVDYIRFCGQKIKLKLKQVVSGQKVFVGVLLGLKENSTEAKERPCVQVDVAGKIMDFDLDSILFAHLIFEFGSSSKTSRKKNSLFEKHHIEKLK